MSAPVSACFIGQSAGVNGGSVGWRWLADITVATVHTQFLIYSEWISL